MPPWKIIFAGTPEFAVPSLQALAAADSCQVDLVVTQPDKPVGRKQTLTPPAVKVAAHELQIPVIQPTKLEPSDLPAHDFLVVVAYGQLLTQVVLDTPRVAPINLHASLLPRWRGASPMQHSLLHGDTETGITAQRMVKALDAGPILAQHTTAIAPRETITTLHHRLAVLSAKLIVDTLQAPLTETPQDESLVTTCGKLSREIGNVDPATMTAEEIDRHIRALVPWPGVRTTINGHDVKLIAAQLTPNESAYPLACTEGTLYITQMQSPGKSPVSGAAWQRGH